MQRFNRESNKMAPALEGLQKVQVESDERMKKDIARDFTGEDLKNLPEYIKKEEDAYEKRRSNMQMFALLVGGLMVLSFFLLTAALNVPGPLIKNTLEYAEVGAFILLVFSIILLRFIPKNGKLRIIRIGKGALSLLRFVSCFFVGCPIPFGFLYHQRIIIICTCLV